MTLAPAAKVDVLAERLEDHAAALTVSFGGLLEALRVSLEEASQSSLDHLLVYDKAAEAAKVSSSLCAATKPTC